MPANAFFKKNSPSPIIFALMGLCFLTGARDAFVTASIAEPSNLIPFFASDSASAEISRLVFNGLVKYDKDLKLTGDLAESWEVLDGGLRIVFHLRRGVLWQDGQPFTAEDVAFTFKKLTDPATPTPYGGDFQKVQALNVLDPHTVEVIYKEAFSPGLASWGMGMVPKHVLANENLMNTAFARRPIGTGPYRLKRWVPGQSIELEANPDYFKGEPGIRRYLYRIIPDLSTTFLELQIENLDFAGLTPLQFQRQTGNDFFKKRYRKFRYPSQAYVYLGYNLKHPYFSDKSVRKAIGLAISKKEIVDATLMGLGRPASGPFLPSSWAYDASIPEDPFDPEVAKRLLAGKKFSFTLLTNQGNDSRRMACEIIQRRLADVGIDVKIQVVEWGTFLKEFIDKRRFDAVLLAWQLPQDPDVHDIFHSSAMEKGFNFISYSNPEVDALLEEGRRLFPEEERAAVYHQVHQILNEDEPYTFLYVPDALPIVHSRFQNVEPAAAGIGHNFIHWEVDENDIRY